MEDLTEFATEVVPWWRRHWPDKWLWRGTVLVLLAMAMRSGACVEDRVSALEGESRAADEAQRRLRILEEQVTNEAKKTDLETYDLATRVRRLEDANFERHQEMERFFESGVAGPKK